MSDLISYLSTINRPPVKFHPQRTSNSQRVALVHKGRIGDLFVRWCACPELIAGFIMTFRKIQQFVMYACQLNLKRNV